MKLFKIICLFIVAILLNSCEKSDPDNATIATIAVQNITVSTAQSGGVITLDGMLPVIVRGICWSKNENPTFSDSHAIDGTGFGVFTNNIVNINAGSKYFVKAFYINSQDTVYGNLVEFTTPDNLLFNPNLEYGTVTDIDGNLYKTITIGTQTWMGENLKVTHFRNGDAIPNETDLNKWGSFQITSSAYCWYNNDISNKKIYGAMYNWYAASDQRNIAPIGYHVSTADDWQKLDNFLGHNLFQGNGYKISEATTAHWRSDNMNSFTKNETGFTAVPGGKVVVPPYGFIDIGAGYAYFWSSTGTWDGSSCVYVAADITIDSMAPNCRGFNIRCVKD
jgi:uncharacterized protein (TIGR02145 family)